MALELVFLGTGTSAGVPMIGCDCAVCTSDDPRDQRSRPSAVVQYLDPDGLPRRILIDTSPELRTQIVRHRINEVDGVMFTHAHADHIFGMDDLRRFNAVMQRPLDIYAEAAVIERLRVMFTYIFEPHRNVNQSFVAQLVAHVIEPQTSLELFGARWTPLRLLHGRLPILGFRVDLNGASLAYCTDVSSLPPQTWPMLEDLDVFVLDALRYRHHPTHLTVDQALDIVERLQPRQTYFTHIAHDICHAELDARLPEGVNLSYDGLAVTCGQPTSQPAPTAEGI